MVPVSRILELYYSIKLAYTSNYDFFKYRGKLKNKYDGERSKFYPQLLKIQKKFQTEEEVCLHISNLISQDVYISFGARDEYVNKTLEQLIYLNSLDQYFVVDILNLFQENGGFKQLQDYVIESEGHMNAPILDAFIGGKIDILLFALLDSVMEFSSRWKSPVWKLYKKKALLQSQFFAIKNAHKLKVMGLLKKHLTEN